LPPDITMSELKRTTAHIVRLADLAHLPVAAASRPVVSEQPVKHVPEVGGRKAPAPVEQAPAASRRRPHLIGSTMPGPLVSGLEEEWVRPPSQRPMRQRVRGPARDVPRLPRGVVQQWPVTMDATGSGYARIWLGNALLMLLTLGLAWPWAHQRAQRYFLRHTQLAGHRLDFDLPNRLLMPRLGMTAALWLGLVGAAMGSFWVGMVALTLGAMVWPLLVYWQINHQIGALTWAGRSLWFDGPWGGMYRASSLPVALCLGAIWMVALGARQGVDHAWQIAAVLMAVWALFLPVALGAFYRYRQKHIRLGPLRLQWLGKRADVVAAFVRTAWWGGMCVCIALGLAAVVLAAWLARGQGLSNQGAASVLALAVGVALSLWWPALDAALIGVVWNRTGNRHLRFRSRLSMTAYARLYARLAWRLVVTLGLYWPWAVVAARRMRWQAVTVWSRVDAEVLKNYWMPEPEPDSVQPPVAVRAERQTAEQTTQPSVASRYGTLD
jgi:uncharacterized membrane protein YjgN (DUF898 family)